MNGIRYNALTLLREVVMIALAALFAAPLYLLFAISLKTDEQVNTNPLALPFASPQWGNYLQAWTHGGTTEGMGRALLNSVVITVVSVVLLIIVSSLVAYVIARRTSKMANGMYLVTVIGVIVPITLGLLPLYSAMRHLGLVSTYTGVIVLHVAVHVPFAVFLYAGFIRALPEEFEEAAQLDGAGTFGVLYRVVLPLLRPITVTIAILSGLVVWNDFFLSLVFLSGTKLATLPLALNSFVSSESYTQWNLVFAGVVISILPMLLLFLLAQRHFMKGLAGGIRG